MSLSDISDNKCLPIIYATYYEILKDVAKEYGYALAIHGSLVRDMDLIAVPWMNDVKDPLDMLRAMLKAIGRNREKVDDNPYDSIGQKPHGRTAYTIMCGGGGYLDISILERKQSNA